MCPPPSPHPRPLPPHPPHTAATRLSAAQSRTGALEAELAAAREEAAAARGAAAAAAAGGGGGGLHLSPAAAAAEHASGDGEPLPAAAGEGGGAGAEGAPPSPRRGGGEGGLAGRLERSLVRCAQLQQRVHELKAAAAAAAAAAGAAGGGGAGAFSGPESVDRRVVRALVLQFLSIQRRSGHWAGYGSPRARDALLILAGMLGLSPEERSEAGCEDEVVSPGEAGARAALGVAGAISTVVRGGAPRAAHAEGAAALAAAAPAGAAAPEPPPSPSKALGLAFAQFLLDETGA